MVDLPRCAVCRTTVQAGQDVVFRRDGRVQHVAACPEVTCPVCTRPIRPTDPIRRDGDVMLHGHCWMRRARLAQRQAGDAETVLTLRDKILEKIRAGILPDDLSQKLGRAFGSPDVCDACDAMILRTHAAYTYERGEGGVLHFHIGCAGLWQAELLRRGVQREL